MAQPQKRAGRKLTPAREALSDQVLAILRDAAPHPVGTGAIGEALGPWVYRWNTCGHPDICDTPSHWGQRTHRAHPREQYASILKRLEREGLVEHFVVERAKGLNPQGQHYWRYIGDQDG